MTSEADRRLLRALAGDAISAHVLGTAPPRVPECPAAREPGGAFVSLHAGDQLRGCIGHTESDQRRGRVIAHCAVQACSRDPRFPPIAADELRRIDIELSLLGALEPVVDADQIEIGVHGLVVEHGSHRGLLLPQVAAAWKWDRDQFLAQACRKAGLPHDAWLRGATIWRFTAEVF